MCLFDKARLARSERGVLYCRLAASKQKQHRDGLSDPVIFDNLDYSRLSDAPPDAAVNVYAITIIRGPKLVT